jgi:polysaccharide pyruvyl transferase WcaK-like protein
MNIFFVNDSSGNLNWGSRASTYMLRHMLTASGGRITATLPLKRLCHLDWQARPLTHKVYNAVVPTRPGKRQRLTTMTLNQITPFLPDVIPTTWNEFETRAQQVLSGRSLTDVKAAIQTCDLVVLNGEGGIFGRQRESRAMLFIGYLAKRHFQKAVILTNQTSDLNDPRLLEMARHVYPIFDDVVFRDPDSANVCQSFCDGSVAADAAFHFTPSPTAAWLEVAGRQDYYHLYPIASGTFNPREPYVCVGGSSIYYREDRPTFDPIPVFTKLCERLLERTQVVLTAAAEPDLQLFEPIARKLGLPLIHPATPPQQAVDLLANAAAYIGGRWHSSIFAFTGGTPVIALDAHTFKVKSLLAQMGVEAHPFDAFKIERDLEAILALLDDYLGQGQILRQRLRSRAKQLGQLAWENARFLKQQPDVELPVVA